MVETKQWTVVDKVLHQALEKADAREDFSDRPSPKFGKLKSSAKMAAQMLNRQRLYQSKLVQQKFAKQSSGQSCRERSSSLTCINGPVLVDSQSLSPDLIDSLADSQQDWISLLHEDWEIDWYSLACLSHTDSDNHSPTFVAQTSYPKIGEVIHLISPSDYRPVSVTQTMFWCHTSCLQVAGLGRVRLVISFAQANLGDRPQIFVTNRLEWSAHKVLEHWVNGFPHALRKD